MSDCSQIGLGLVTTKETELLPSGKQSIISNRVHWAKTYLKKAGLMDATRRGYIITDRGRHVLQSNPQRIDNDFLSQFQEFKVFRGGRNEPGDGPFEKTVSEVGLHAATPDEIVRKAHKDINLALSQELLERIMKATPQFFEQMLVELILAMGYGGSTEEAGRAIGRSGDGGIDGVIDQDTLGLDRVYIQAKRYDPANSVGPSAIRDFFGSLDMHKAAKGLFVTTSTFTAQAKETASRLGKRIVLVDGEQLTQLMIKHNVGCRIEETLHLKKVDEDFFEPT